MKSFGPRVNKSIKDLILEVGVGNYDDFNAYLTQQNSQLLKLSKVFPPHYDYYKLFEAIQGTPIISLDLSNNKNIGPNSAEKIGLALRNFHQVTSLNLSGIKIGPGGAEKLGTQLRDSGLTSINLSGVRLGLKGVKNFVKALGETTAINDVNLTNIGLETWGDGNFDQVIELVRTLQECKSPVTQLDLSGCTINADWDGIPELAAAIRETKLLKITGWYIVGQFNCKKANESLESAFDHNRQRLATENLSKSLISLQYLPESSKQLCHLLLPSKQEEIKYAGVIFANLPQELQNEILTFVPYMNFKRANELQKNVLENGSPQVQEPENASKTLPTKMI